MGKWQRRWAVQSRRCVNGGSEVGRQAKGILSQFDDRMAQKAEAFKDQHRGCGADRVLIELRKEEQIRGLRLPKRSWLAVFFKERCPLHLTFIPHFKLSLLR
jgi:hypothetical protein